VLTTRQQRLISEFNVWHVSYWALKSQEFLYVVTFLTQDLGFPTQSALLTKVNVGYHINVPLLFSDPIQNCKYVGKFH
jgi:hypothetical protein